MKIDFYLTLTVLLPLLFGPMALFCFAIGLRGLVGKRPFLISSRWLNAVNLLVFAPSILQPFLFRILDIGRWDALGLMGWLPLVMFASILIMFSFKMKGYMAFAVTDASFREGLIAALKKLELPYEESLSVMRLPSLGADLQVAVQSGMGTGLIKVKEPKFGGTLRQIVQAMNDYFRSASVPTNMFSCVFFTIIGVFMVIFAVTLLFCARMLLPD